jgi:abhydrolase domain-containing protein 11
MAERLDRTVFAVDIRNHGDSPHASEMTFDLMARDTVEFLRERGVSRTVLVGHSLGGSSAMFTALRYPELVERLVVLDSSPEYPRRGPSVVGGLLGLLAGLDLLSLARRREADLRLQEKIPSSSLRDFLLTNLHRDEVTGAFRWKANLETLQKSLSHLTNFPDMGGATYPGPTLFLGGGNSDVIGESSLPSIHRLFPNSTVSHIPRAGHLLHVDQPSLFLEALLEFCPS